MRLIEYDAALDAALTGADKWDGGSNYERDVAIEEEMNKAPTIDPEDLRPKGEWEIRGGKRYCTHCGKRACVTRDREDFWYTVGTDFCPICGADMRGGEG